MVEPGGGVGGMAAGAPAADGARDRIKSFSMSRNAAFYRSLGRVSRTVLRQVEELLDDQETRAGLEGCLAPWAPGLEVLWLVRLWEWRLEALPGAARMIE